MSAAELYPRWVREYLRYLPIKTQFYVYGNVHDQVLWPMPAGETTSPRFAPLVLREFFHHLLTQQGYRFVGFYNIADGMLILPAVEQALFEQLARRESPAQTEALAHASVGDALADQRSAALPMKPEAAVDAIRAALANSTVPCAFVVEFASRLVANPAQLHAYDDRVLFLKLFRSSQESVRVRVGDGTLNNHLTLVCDKLNDLPSWLYLDNPSTKLIQVELPDAAQRGARFDSLAPGFPESNVAADELRALRQVFVDLTDGLKLAELESIRILSMREAIPLRQLREAIERYKYGVAQSLWDNLAEEKLANAEATLQASVKGQDEAISMVVDIVKRARMGLSGLQHSGSNKPRGILFFAGPTGAGKTELAKALAKLLFGDERACVRFDMSEYSQEHADQRLLGAPPGYVGYEEGGQLTNRVKRNPFCVLLFDEIEKAHPRLFDKFLQILEDGRMTDGKGETVYFSESIIVFTSNIGSDRIDLEMPPAEVRKTVLQALDETFRLELHRPELLNRIGNNFVVFGFITPDIARQIVDKILTNIARQLLDGRGWHFEFSAAVRTFLYERAAGSLAMGGRGIGNMIEEVLLNPLGRSLFGQPPPNGARILVRAIEATVHATHASTTYAVSLEVA